MKKIIDLTTALLESKIIKKNQVSAVIASGDILSSGKQTGDGQILFKHEYDALLSINNFRGNYAHFIQLMALITIWLNENTNTESGEERVSADKLFDYEADPFQDDSCDIDLNFHFVDQVHFSEMEAGTTGLSLMINGIEFRQKEMVVNLATKMSGMLGDYHPG